ncbi:tumor necrosis factor ligand superfamily member 9 [Pyxicephalus adspersus]|uniref:tumor necrosis factor ligand superfamily member 9 n=1 Tax=Pyxicephalus adspersus TaxID=30357 RepID=UPI003B5C31A1
MTVLPPPVRSEDPESQKASPKTCRCLDYCLVFSMVLLTMVVGTMGVFYMTWERSHFEKSIGERIEIDKLRNSAQLVIDSEQIVDEHINWSTSDVDGTFLGQDFSYDHRTQELLVKKTGYYYIYSQIALKHISKDHFTEERDLTVSVLRKDRENAILKLNIHIGPSSNRSSLSSFSASIQYLSANTKLKVQLRTSHKITDWHFDNSFMGLFWFSERLTGSLQSE